MYNAFCGSCRINSCCFFPMLLSHMILSRSLNGGVRLTKNTRRQKEEKHRHCSRVLYTELYPHTYKRINKTTTTTTTTTLDPCKIQEYTHTRIIFPKYNTHTHTRYFCMVCVLFLMYYGERTFSLLNHIQN